MKRMIGLMVAVMALASVVLAGGGASKYSASTSATACSVMFAPQAGQTVVTELATSCDVSLGTVSVYGRSGSGRTPVTSTNGASVTVIPVANTSYGLTTNDIVVYVYANGATPVYRTVSDCTSSNVTLNTGVTAPQVNDAIYEVSLLYKIVVADNSAAAGTNKLAAFSGPVFVSPGDSPVYITLQSATNTCLSVSVQ